MLAIDTNVVVRYIVADEARQAERARRLIDSQAVFVSMTVILETEWVLRDAYGFSRKRITEALRAFAGLPNVRVEDERKLKLAIDWAAEALDFADSIHLANADLCDGFATFDKAFVKATKSIRSLPVRLL